MWKADPTLGIREAGLMTSCGWPRRTQKLFLKLFLRKKNLQKTMRRPFPECTYDQKCFGKITKIVQN
jgi:hypothetical protein